MKRSFIFTTGLVIFLKSFSVFAFEITLENPDTKTKVKLISVAESKDRYLIEWNNLKGSIPSGAMVYSRTDGNNDQTYLAVGGGGLFSLVNRGEKTLIAGTLVDIYDLIDSNPLKPLKMRVNHSEPIDSAKMKSAYQKFENIAAATESRADIEKAMNAQLKSFQSKCACKMSVQMDWSSFEKAKKLEYSKQVVSVLQGFEELIADKDYLNAVKSINKLLVSYGETESPFTKKDAQVSVVMGATTYNLRESVTPWAKENL